MAKYKYIGDGTLNIQKGEILDQEPTTWSVKCGEGRKEIQVLYVKNYKGYDTPIRLSEFEMCEGKNTDTGDRQLTIPDVSTSTWEFSYDEDFADIEMTLEVPDNKDPYDVLLEHVPDDIAPTLWYRAI